MNPHTERAGGANHDGWYGPVLFFVLCTGLVLRVTNVGLLPAFVDETCSLVAAQDYGGYPVMERLFLGKYLGYLLQRPAMEFANNPLWAGRVLSAILGTLGASLAADTVRRLAGGRARGKSAGRGQASETATDDPDALLFCRFHCDFGEGGCFLRKRILISKTSACLRAVKPRP